MSSSYRHTSVLDHHACRHWRSLHSVRRWSCPRGSSSMRSLIDVWDMDETIWHDKSKFTWKVWLDPNCMGTFLLGHRTIHRYHFVPWSIALVNNSVDLSITWLDYTVVLWYAPSYAADLKGMSRQEYPTSYRICDIVAHPCCCIFAKHPFRPGIPVVDSSARKPTMQRVQRVT